MQSLIYRQAISSLCAAVLVGALPACSKTSDGGSTANAQSPQSSSAIPAGTICEQKLLSVNDLVGIYDEPFTGTKPLSGDAQTCYFTTARDNQLRVTLRPGMGKATIASFTSALFSER